MAIITAMSKLPVSQNAIPIANAVDVNFQDTAFMKLLFRDFFMLFPILLSVVVRV